MEELKSSSHNPTPSEIALLRQEVEGLREQIRELKSVVESRTMLSVAPDDSIFLNVDGTLLRFPSSEYRHALSYANNPAFENWVRIALIQILGEGMCFLDVGANLGTVSAFAARRVGAVGKLFAVEPIVEFEALIQENVRLNNPFCQLKVRSAVASDEPGEQTLFLDRFDSRSSSLFELDAARRKEARKCPAIRLDDEMEEGWVPDVVKIDAEGSELFVLEGLRNTISKTHTIQIILEWVPRYFAVAGYTWRDVLEFAYDLGLHVRTIHPVYGAFLETPPDSLERFEGNVLLTKP